MAAVDAVILLTFVAFAIHAGWRARRQASQNLNEYFLADRSLSGWSAGISMAATQFAADTPLLVTGLVATAGLFSLWRLWIYAIAFLLMGFVLAPAWRRAQVLTDAELAELRYAGRAAAWLRAIKALYFGTLFNCTVLAMVLLAAVTVAEPFLLWDAWLHSFLFDPIRALVEWVGVPLVAGTVDPALVWTLSARNLISLVALVGVTGLYATAGGLRGVVRTDIGQFAVMMVATAAYAGWVLHEVGGFDGLLAALRERYAAGGTAGLELSELLALEPSRASEAGMALLAVFALQWLVQINADGTGYLAQRSMACRSDRDARLAAIVFTWAQVGLRSLLWLPIVLGLLVLFPPDPGLAGEALRADREASFVSGMQALPIGLRGLMFTAMLAALASTVDTHLNWGASYWTHDLYERFIGPWLGIRPSPRSLVRVARASNVLILIVAMGIMSQLSSIQTTWQISLLLGAGAGVILVLRWLWWRITARGELATLLASALAAPVLLFATPELGEAARLLAMAVIATMAGVGASLAFGPEPKSRLEAFWQRVQPPGFWQPFDGGRGRGRLARGLIATAAAALSLFCAVGGIASWGLSSPPPTWLPSRPAWVALLLVTSLALLPWWWRAAVRGPREGISTPT